MFYTYILQSEFSGMHYIGSTQDLLARVDQHNDSNNTKYKTTGRFKGPWKLVYYETFKTRSDAMKREKQIKSWKSKKAVEKLLKTYKVESRCNRD